MSARRRRAALWAVGALLIALFCASLIEGAEGVRRGVLIGLVPAWLVVAGAFILNLLRTAPADAPEPPTVEHDEPA